MLTTNDVKCTAEGQGYNYKISECELNLSCKIYTCNNCKVYTIHLNEKDQFKKPIVQLMTKQIFFG